MKLLLNSYLLVSPCVPLRILKTYPVYFKLFQCNFDGNSIAFNLLYFLKVKKVTQAILIGANSYLKEGINHKHLQ